MALPRQQLYNNSNLIRKKERRKKNLRVYNVYAYYNVSRRRRRKIDRTRHENFDFIFIFFEPNLFYKFRLFFLFLFVRNVWNYFKKEQRQGEAISHARIIRK
jgi:hypothetical protein